MTAIASYTAWRQRVHTRVCEATGSCTCPSSVGPETLTEARELARAVHAKYAHPGDPDRCESPHDVICKALG